MTTLYQTRVLYFVLSINCCLNVYLGLIKHFYPLVLSDNQKRHKAGLPSQPLEPLVRLYNAFLQHMASQATGTDLQAFRWPPPEFAPPHKFSPRTLPPLYWNSVPYLESIQRSLSRLAVPHECSVLPVGVEETDWSTQCTLCMEFVRSWVDGIVGGSEDQAIILLLSRQAT